MITDWWTSRRLRGRNGPWLGRRPLPVPPRGLRLWTQLRHELLHSVAGHKGLFRGFFPRMRAQARGMCDREDTATLMKNWKCKH